jgi:hypothetical protein
MAYGLGASDSHRHPRFSISQVSTLAASFDDDVRTYAEAGVDAIGVWELKLGDGPDDEALEAFRTSGLGAASAVPLVPSILPLPLLPGPDDPRARVDAILRSLERLAPFRPVAACARSAARRSASACASRSSRSSAREARAGRRSTRWALRRS